MADQPRQTHVFHISHHTNLGSVVDDGLLSDVEMISRGGPETAVGMSTIKEAPLIRPVTCHPGTNVGEYVPFFFCPRSVMLYILYMGNHPELTYRGGQEPMVHLQTDFDQAVEWAEGEDVAWAFTTGNARAGYAQFHDGKAQLVESIGVCSEDMKQTVEESLAEAGHRPPVRVQPRWYF